MDNGRTYGAFSGGAGSDAYDVMQMAKQGGQKLLLEEDIFSFNALMKAYERQQAKRSSSMGLTQLISTIAVPAPISWMFSISIMLLTCRPADPRPAYNPNPIAPPLRGGVPSVV